MNRRLVGKGSRIALAWAVLGAILACGGGSSSSDDDPPATSTGQAGDISLSPGFMPDPRTASGTAGGPNEANSTFGQQCRGWVPNAPQHTINLERDFTRLRIIVAAQAGTDTTMAIRTPAGVYICDDDGGESFNPKIEQAFGPGRHEIFIGTYMQPSEANPAATYNIAFSELSHVNATTVGAPPGGPAGNVPLPPPPPPPG